MSTPDLATRVEAMDSVVKAVIESFVTRAEVGKAKYGADLDRTDLTNLQWIKHTQEEFMDGILYLEKLKRTLGALKGSI
jgi:hypothetical protein